MKNYSSPPLYIILIETIHFDKKSIKFTIST